MPATALNVYRTRYLIHRSATHYALLPLLKQTNITPSLQECNVGFGKMPTPSAVNIAVAKLANPQPSSKLLELGNILLKKPRGSKIIVASQWVELLVLIEKYLENTLDIRCVKYIGSQSPAGRHVSLERFREREDVECLLLSLYAGGAGLNITEANRLILMDLPWNPAREQQCIGRLHRYGQRRAVAVTRLVIPGTIEDRIIEHLQGKQRLSDEALAHNLSPGQSFDVPKLDLPQWRFLLNLTKDGKRKS